MSTEQDSKERTAAYVAALEREAEAYNARVAAAKIEGDKVAEARYATRAKAVAEEIARAKKQGQTPRAARETEAREEHEEA